MSRAILKIALARTLHRQPTEQELTEYLQALRDLGCSERLYVPKRLAPDLSQIHELRMQGRSVREIAAAMKLRRTTVQRALLAPNPALSGATES